MVSALDTPASFVRATVRRVNTQDECFPLGSECCVSVLCACLRPLAVPQRMGVGGRALYLSGAFSHALSISPVVGELNPKLEGVAKQKLCQSRPREAEEGPLQHILEAASARR